MAAVTMARMFVVVMAFMIVVIVVLVAVALVCIMIVGVVLMPIAFVLAMLIALVLAVVMARMIFVIVAVMILMAGASAAGRAGKVDPRSFGCGDWARRYEQRREYSSQRFGTRHESPQVCSTSDHTLQLPNHTRMGRKRVKLTSRFVRKSKSGVLSALSYRCFSTGAIHQCHVRIGQPRLSVNTRATSPRIE